jgi:chromosome segregation ATPase
VRDELASAHERYVGEVEAMREEIRLTESQRREAVEERERLRSEIATVEREYGELDQTRVAGSPIHDEKLRAIAERKARVERALELHDQSIKSFENELGEVRSELDAAETLLGEMEHRRGELDAKLRDRNRQIRQLQALADQARRDTRELELGAARHARDGAAARHQDAERSRLEEQLEAWVAAPGEAEVDFSAHSRTGKVESSFARVDRAFVDRYFTHVTNPAYERGARRLIRVVSEPDGDTGQLIVALDDDAGRTLGLRFALRPESPDGSYVGFVLALLLRAHCRDFRSFAIRVR